MENNGTVLLVEDDKELSRLTTALLTHHAYDVYPTFTLDMARRFLDAKEPDFILLDGELPDGCGFDFCKEIRGKTKARIIFVTGKSKQLYEMTGILAGGDDFISKPYIIEDLLALLAP
jgi:DNA-binding response OmpR family regulator